VYNAKDLEGADDDVDDVTGTNPNTNGSRHPNTHVRRNKNRQ
jgi:hypothetical protein